MDKKTTENNNEPTYHVRPDLPNMFIDHFVFQKKADDMILMSAYSEMQLGLTEQARMVIKKEHALKIVEALAKILEDAGEAKQEEKPHTKKSRRN